MSDFDALAELFLSTDAAANAPGASSGTPMMSRFEVPPSSAHNRVASPALEAIFMGSLPVLGAAWLAPYARHVADELREPVAIVRLLADRSQVDVIAPAGFPKISALPCDTLEKALHAACRGCARVLIRTDQAREHELACVPGLSRLTLLTGADEAAIVSCYSVMKQLDAPTPDDECEETGNAPDHDARRVQPPFALAVMGAPGDRSRSAEQSLRRAAAAFLNREIAEVAHIQRIGATPVSTLYRGPGAASLDSVLAAIRHAQTQPPTLRLARNEHDDGASPSSPQPEEQIEAKPSIAQLHAAPHAAQLQSQQSASTRTPSREHAPTSENWTASLAPDGVRKIATTCPFAPSVRLGADAAQTLHIFVAASKSSPAKDPVGQLLVAASWAHDHADLLARAHPESLREWTAQRDPVLHVLTDDPALVRSLLTTGVRVHVVARAGAAWACIALCERE